MMGDRELEGQDVLQGEAYVAAKTETPLFDMSAYCVCVCVCVCDIH